MITIQKLAKGYRSMLATAFIISPFMVFAQTTSNLQSVITLVVGYLNSILALLMGIAVVIFVYNVIKYFIQPSDNRTEAWQYVMWSLIGFFVIVSFWGIVNVLIGTFNFPSNSPQSWTNFFNIFPS